MKRCEAYKNAGVDAILIHSKKSDFTEIENFLKEWKNRLPVVIVPTNYYTTPTDEFRKHSIFLINIFRCYEISYLCHVKDFRIDLQNLKPIKPLKFGVS